MKLHKIITVLMLCLILIGTMGIPVLANTNEKVILKNSDGEYLIYYKQFYNQSFKFAISTNKDAKEEELNFTLSAKDKPQENAEGLNIAYINKDIFNKIFDKNNSSLTAYIWVKNMQDEFEIKADKIDLNNALTDSMISIVNTTTKANEATSRIEIDTTKEHITYSQVEGITATLRTGKIEIKEKNNSKYYYNLIKVSDDNKLADEMYKLAEKMQINHGENTYEKLVNEKRFYDLYNALIPTDKDWKKVENLEILQPEIARTGDKYIVYIKEENKKTSVIDAKLFNCRYEYEERRVNEDDKVVTETVKLPVTFDSGTILFTILGVIVLALIVLGFIRKKSDKNDENE